MTYLLLFKGFEEHEFLVGSPLLIEDGVVEFVDDVVFIGEVVDIGETADAIVVLFCEYFGVFADISLTVIALYLIGGVDDILGEEGGT